ncbi:hypothetical protein EP7_005274 [Isosphaeraceae bacterium EP7]
MRSGDPGRAGPESTIAGRGPSDIGRGTPRNGPGMGVGMGRDGDESPAGQPAAPAPARLIETVVSPFHCLYQDALHFHTQSQLCLARSEADSSRHARASLLLYLAAAEALLHQAAVELARPDLARLIDDPSRPMPLASAWRLLPALAQGTTAGDDPDAPPWPQFAELLAVRDAWAYPGPAADRRAYYRERADGSSFDPLQSHQVPPGLSIAADQLTYPRTGLPRDPYALRPRHLDTARGVLDAAIETLNRRLGGALTAANRHRREPTVILKPKG